MFGCWFLGFSAMLPRTTLLVCWLGSMIPANSTPFVVDVMCAIFAPRALIAFWLYEAGQHPLLIGVFLALEAWSWFVSAGQIGQRRAERGYERMAREERKAQKARVDLFR